MALDDIKVKDLIHFRPKKDQTYSSKTYLDYVGTKEFRAWTQDGGRGTAFDPKKKGKSRTSKMWGDE